MTMAKARDKDKNDSGSCPVGKFFSDLEKASGNKSKVWEHLSRSKLEFLKAVKCLVDDKIEDLEKERPVKGKKKATKIRVE